MLIMDDRQVAHFPRASECRTALKRALEVLSDAQRRKGTVPSRFGKKIQIPAE